MVVKPGYFGAIVPATQVGKWSYDETQFNPDGTQVRCAGNDSFPRLENTLALKITASRQVTVLWAIPTNLLGGHDCNMNGAFKEVIAKTSFGARLLGKNILTLTLPRGSATRTELNGQDTETLTYEGHVILRRTS